MVNKVSKSAKPKAFGRVDLLVEGMTKLLVGKLETKLQLPGLVNGVMPILEDEIKTHIGSKKVISKKYEGLAKLVGQRIGMY